MDAGKYRLYLNMVNFVNNVLPMLVTEQQLELCKKYIVDGKISIEELQKLVDKK